jgi:hypothetical protein
MKNINIRVWVKTNDAIEHFDVEATSYRFTNNLEGVFSDDEFIEIMSKSSKDKTIFNMKQIVGVYITPCI